MPGVKLLSPRVAIKPKAKGAAILKRYGGLSSPGRFAGFNMPKITISEFISPL